MSLFWNRVSFLFLFAILLNARSYGQAVSFEQVHVGGVKADVVIADLRSSEVGVKLYVPSYHPANGRFPHEAFSTMISHALPTAAIDGTYYDTRTFKPVGTLVENGQMIQRGSHGIAVCFDEKNQVSFYKIRDLQSFPWQKYKVIISTGPTLLQDGHVHLYPRSEKFHDPDLFKPASRSALGVTAENKLLMVAIPQKILLRDLAWIMKKLGAVQAVSLDGGSSTALYYRGRYLVHPSRVLTNIVTIEEQKQTSIQKEAIVSKE